MKKSTCVLCEKSSFDGTNFCETHLIEQHPPVSAKTQSAVPLMSVLPENEPRWNALAISAGALAGIVIVLALITFSVL